MLAWVIVGLCIIVLILGAAIRLDQYLLRRKAEHLLSDLRSLEMRKSTYDDAQRVIDRWKENIHQRSPCQPNRCDVEIVIGGFYFHNEEFFVHHPKFMRVWQVLGGRPAGVDGYVRVRKNVVWGKGIRAIVLGYSAAQGWDVELVGRMGSGPPDVVSTLHPEYDVGIGRHTTGVFSSGVYADFTPYADPADVRRLMDIDFSCLTRWRSCQTGADIAPTVWNEATAENEKGAARNVGQRTCGPAVVRVLARESRRAVIGEVSRISIYAGVYNDSNHRPYDPSDFGQVKILFKDDLKRSNLDSLSAMQSYSFNESLPVKEKVGDRFILFFRYKDQFYSDNYRACELLPATKEYLEAARRGVAEDWADHDDSF